MENGLAKYVRDKNTGQAYELQPSGYYKVIKAPGQGSVDVNSINDVYSQQAQNEAAPIYQPQEQQTKQQNERSTNDLRTRLAALYTDRGLGNSSFYTGDVARMETDQATDLSTKLANLLSQKNNYITNRVSSLQENQRQGTAQDIAQANLEQDRAYKAQQDALAEQRAKEQQDYQLKLLQAQIGAYKSGNGTGGGTSNNNTAKYTVTKDKSGGYQFKLGNKAISPAQYIVGVGGGYSDLAAMLAKSGNPGDRIIAEDIYNGVSQQDLVRKYPWVFKGV